MKIGDKVLVTSTSSPHFQNLIVEMQPCIQKGWLHLYDSAPNGWEADALEIQTAEHQDLKPLSEPWVNKTNVYNTA